MADVQPASESAEQTASAPLPEPPLEDTQASDISRLLTATHEQLLQLVCDLLFLKQANGHMERGLVLRNCAVLCLMMLSVKLYRLHAAFLMLRCQTGYVPSSCRGTSVGGMTWTLRRSMALAASSLSRVCSSWLTCCKPSIPKQPH